MRRKFVVASAVVVSAGFFLAVLFYTALLTFSLAHLLKFTLVAMLPISVYAALGFKAWHHQQRVGPKLSSAEELQDQRLISILRDLALRHPTLMLGDKFRLVLIDRRVNPDVPFAASGGSGLSGGYYIQLKSPDCILIPEQAMRFILLHEHAHGRFCNIDVGYLYAPAMLLAALLFGFIHPMQIHPWYVLLDCLCSLLLIATIREYFTLMLEGKKRIEHSWLIWQCMVSMTLIVFGCSLFLEQSIYAALFDALRFIAAFLVWRPIVGLTKYVLRILNTMQHWASEIVCDCYAATETGDDPVIANGFHGCPCKWLVQYQQELGNFPQGEPWPCDAERVTYSWRQIFVKIPPTHPPKQYRSAAIKWFLSMGG